MAVLGVVKRQYGFCRKYVKAGQRRLLGWRPVVRGFAMNPVDHPHGGRTHSGIPVTPWGKLTVGKKTRSKISKFEGILKR